MSNRKPDELKRGRQVALRLMYSEHKRLQSQARRDNVRLSSLVRTLILCYLEHGESEHEWSKEVCRQNEGGQGLAVAGQHNAKMLALPLHERINLRMSKMPELTHTIIKGDCQAVMSDMADKGILFDAVVSDPPYGIGFRGQKWDAKVPPPKVWEKCGELLRPGAMLLIASSTRKQHRMASALEQAGLEVLDVICWHYATGFPKSRNVTLDIADSPHFDRDRHHGVGTALKPATEFWTLCRKPFVGTYAENLLAHGTGCMNIEATRIGYEDSEKGQVDTNSIAPHSVGKGPFGPKSGKPDAVGTTLYEGCRPFSSQPGDRWQPRSYGHVPRQMCPDCSTAPRQPRPTGTRA